MSNKGNQTNQNRLLSLRIANIKFSIFHRTNRKKSSRGILQNSTLQQFEDDIKPKERVVLSRNCFIPSTSIKSQTQIERMQKINNIPLFPVDVTYSKFPNRRPKSIKPRNFFPVYRERIVTFPNRKALHLSQTSKSSQKMERSLIVHSRTATRSCLILNQSEKQAESFVRYSNLNVKRQINSSTEREKQDNHVIIEKFYI